MRIAATLALILAAAPGAAWEFTPVPVCTLSHATDEASVAVTYDPRRDRPYAIAITLAQPWPEGPLFGIRYDGGRAQTITTDRHVLSDGGRTLTVTDRGFGNVLDGLAFNTTATAVTGDRAVSLPLEGAAPHVEAFRACTAAPLA